jgi:hypothetical protein
VDEAAIMADLRANSEVMRARKRLEEWKYKILEVGESVYSPQMETIHSAGSNPKLVRRVGFQRGSNKFTINGLPCISHFC